MGSWSHFFVKSKHFNIVKGVVQELSRIPTEKIDALPKDFKESLLLDPEANPNYLLLAQTQPNWISVCYNSFSKLKNWANEISERLGTEVVVVTAQTTADHYYYCHYNHGFLVREIEQCHNSDIEEVNLGEPYENESNAILTYAKMVHMTSYFGLEILEASNIKEWTILKGKQDQSTLKGFPKSIL